MKEKSIGENQELHLLLIGSGENDCEQIRGWFAGCEGRGEWHIEQADSISSAVEQLANREYDAILLEEDLDEGSRLPFLRKLQESGVPVVLLNRNGSGRLTARSSEFGSTGCSNHGGEGAKLASLVRCSICRHSRESQHRVAEDALRKLSRAVEQSADLVVITAVDGTIEYVNPAFESLTGYTVEEVIGKKPSLLRSGAQAPEMYKELWETILAGKVFRGTLINKKKNGETFQAEKTITPVRDASGKITHFISNDRDITERKRLEAQLLQATKMDAIGQLAGGVAHDFNNLLMVISSYAELAMDSLAPGHPLSHNLGEIIAASHHAADLTRQLLAFSRKQVQSLQILDLNGVLQELGRMLPRLIGEDIELTMIAGTALGKIKADVVQMEQIIRTWRRMREMRCRGEANW